jgi:hypothetical protein
MTELLHLVVRQSSGQGRILLRYIHHGYSLPEDLKSILRINESMGHELVSNDRYPFYSLIPMTINKTS